MPVAKLSGIFPPRPRAGSDRGPLGLLLHWHRRTKALLLLFGLSVAVAPGCLAQDGHPVAAPTPGNVTAEPKAQPESAAKSVSQKAEAADSARKKQISEESSQLLAMALSLKAEVDKTSKDTLSLKVIRKADEIERMAKTVKEKIKQGAGAS